ARRWLTTWPGPPPSPAARSSCAKPTRTPVNGSSSARWPAPSATGDDLRQVLPGQGQVVAVLADRPERVAGGLRRQLGLAEHAERADPVDRLGDPGRFGQVKLP